MTNEFRHGEHICVLYETHEEQLAVAARYLADGLGRGERCYYVAGSADALHEFRVELSHTGVDANEAVKNGALVVATHDEAHLVDGRFDCERMLALLNQAVETALNDGFTGLRTCGDMSWLLHDPPGCTQVVEYEALLNPFFQGVRASGMCQYDRKRLPATLLDHALATHPSAVVDGAHRQNPFYRPPAIATSRSPRPADVHWKISELRRRA